MFWCCNILADQKLSFAWILCCFCLFNFDNIVNDQFLIISCTFPIYLLVNWCVKEILKVFGKHSRAHSNPEQWVFQSSTAMVVVHRRLIAAKSMFSHIPLVPISTWAKWIFCNFHWKGCLQKTKYQFLAFFFLFTIQLESLNDCICCKQNSSSIFCTSQIQPYHWDWTLI